MAEFHYQPSPTDAYKPGNMKGITKVQPPQVRTHGNKEIRDGRSLLSANAVGKLNENRFSSLKPKSQTK